MEPILFLSKLLTTAERRYWPTELEVACLVWTIKRIRHMVVCSEKPPIVLIDHAATPSLAKSTALTTSSVDKLNNRLIRASQYLSQFDLDLRWRPGEQYIIPDALSRLPAATDKEDAVDDTLDALTFHMTVLEMDPAFKQQFPEAYEQDPLWSQYINTIEDHQELPIEAPLLDQFIRHDGLIYHVDHEDNCYRLCVPKVLLGDVFEQIHGLLHHGFQ